MTGGLFAIVAAGAALAVSKGQGPAAGQEAPKPNAFNPSIGVVVDSRAVLRDREKEAEEATIKEIELSFAAAVDPFLAAEAYLAIADEDGETVVEAEEVFATYRNLGKGLSGKFGKVSGAIGRVNRNHTDQLEYQDYPFVIQSFFGEEGMRGVGASFSYLFPTEPYLDLTVEALVPEDGPVFQGARTSNPVGVGHLRTFFDFSEDLSAQLGFTLANGPSAAGRATVYGVDYTMKYQPGRQDRFWQLEAEAYWAEDAAPGDDRAQGYFVSATTALRPRLFLTGRYDFTELPGTGDDLRAMTANLTLRVSEFHFWRLEYQHIKSSLERDRSRLALQFVWAIGPHPAHKY